MNAVNITTASRFDYSAIVDPLFAQELQNHADEIHALDRGIVHNVIAIGRHLVAAKERLEHGQFTDWLQAEFGLSHSTANNYMAVAERFGQNPNAVGNLPLRTVYALAPASVPDAAVEEAAALAAGGITVTPNQARTIRDDVVAITPADPAPSADQPSLPDRIMATFINGSHVKSTNLLARLLGVAELDLAHELTALVDAGKLRRIGDSGKLFALVPPEPAPTRDRHSGPPYERFLAAFADGLATKTTGMIAHLTGLNNVDQHQVALDTLVAHGLLLRESGQMYRMTDKTPRCPDASIVEDERELYEVARRITDWLDLQTEPRSVLNMVDCAPSATKLATIVNAVEHLLALSQIERVGSSLYRTVLLEVSAPADAPAVTSPDPAQAKAQQLADEMLAYLRANPPQRFMDIFTHVGKNTRQSDMGATIDALIAAGQIEKVTGEYGEQRYRALPETDEPEAEALAVAPAPELDPEIARHSRTITNAQYEMLKAVYQGNPLKRDAPSRTALINRGLIKNLGMGERWEFDKIELTDLGRAVVEYTIESANTMAPFPPADPEPDGAAEFFAGYGIDPDEDEPEQPATTTRPPWTGPNTVYGNDYYPRKDAEQSAATEPITDDQPGEAVSAPPAQPKFARTAEDVVKEWSHDYTQVPTGLIAQLYPLRANTAESLREAWNGEDVQRKSWATGCVEEITKWSSGSPWRVGYALTELGHQVLDLLIQRYPDAIRRVGEQTPSAAIAHLEALLEAVKTAENCARDVTKFTAQGAWNDIDAATLKEARTAIRRAQGVVEKAALHLSNLYAPLTSANEVALKREQPAAAEVH